MNVVAAVIEKDGRILICQRRAGQRHAGKWEFPGGKVEREEEFTAALARELREELSITASIGPEITRFEYSYPGRPQLLLVFYRVTEFEGEPVNVIFEQVRWERPENLPSFDFLEADVEFASRLSRQGSHPCGKH
jgi:8-oxo-dGTP diphosphatase